MRQLTCNVDLEYIISFQLLIIRDPAFPHKKALGNNGKESINLKILDTKLKTVNIRELRFTEPATTRPSGGQPLSGPAATITRPNSLHPPGPAAFNHLSL